MSKDEIIFEALHEDDEGITFGNGEIVFEEEFGTERYFKDLYNEKVENFIKDFLYSNIDEIIKRQFESPEEITEILGNLIDVHYVVRTEYEKHKTKLRVNYRFNSFP